MIFLRSVELKKDALTTAVRASLPNPILFFSIAYPYPIVKILSMQKALRRRLSVRKKEQNKPKNH